MIFCQIFPYDGFYAYRVVAKEGVVWQELVGRDQPQEEHAEAMRRMVDFMEKWRLPEAYSGKEVAP